LFFRQEREAFLPAIQSTKTDAPEIDGGATRTFELDTAKEVDSTTIYKRNLEMSKKDDVNEEYKEVCNFSTNLSVFNGRVL